jgi:hypothetical protein
MARTLKSAPDIHAVPAGLHPPSYTSWSSGCPAQCRDADSIVHRHEVGSPLPQGPRSCPSHAVSSHHHLIDPMRPTRGHIAISPHGGLFTMPSLCGSAEVTREWFRAFVVPSSPTAGSSGIVFQFHDADMGLRQELTGSTLPILPQSASRGRSVSRLHWLAIATACWVARLPSTDLTGAHPQPRETFTSRLSTGRSPFPSLGITTTSIGLLCRQDLHPLI